MQITLQFFLEPDDFKRTKFATPTEKRVELALKQIIRFSKKIPKPIQVSITDYQQIHVGDSRKVPKTFRVEI